MILCPVVGTLGVDFHISQFFGVNPQHYAKYGVIGHPGIDLGIPVGTPLYAPIEGYISMGNEGMVGFGRYVEVTSDPLGLSQQRKYIVLGHLSKFIAGLQNGSYVNAGDLIGMSGGQPGTSGCGDSTGPHVHVGFKRKDKDGNTLNATNGYKGALDVGKNILCWNQTFLIPS